MKACRFHNMITRRVHVSQDAVFEERAWVWGTGNGPGLDLLEDNAEPFHVEYVTIMACGDAQRDEIRTATPTATL